MTKQQGLFYVPLILAFMLLPSPEQRGLNTLATITSKSTTRTTVQGTTNLFLGIALVVLPVLYWDSQRWAVAPSPWDLSIRNYGPLVMAPIDSLAVRAHAWSTVLWFFGATPYGWLLYFLLTVIAGVVIGSTKQSIPRLRFALLAGWLLAYFGAHLLTTIQIWDRYLLPLIPISVLLLAFHSTKSKRWLLPQLAVFHRFTWGAILLLALPGALLAARGRIPIGGDHGAFTGLTDAVAWLQQTSQTGDDHLPLILYQQALGWQLQFYLYDEVQKGEIELRWFANGVTLADNAAKHVAHARYLLQPSWQAQPMLPQHMATRKQLLAEGKPFGVFVLYRIESKPELPCSWCFCSTVSRETKGRTPRRWQLSPLAVPQSRP